MTVPFLDLASAHEELREELEDAALRVLRAGRYLRGVEGERFAAEFALACESVAAVGVANGLEALQLLLEALGIGTGDEVLVSAHTSIATWLAITHAGARPVPVESDPGTMQLDPGDAGARIGPRTAAIVAVHLYGMPADMEALSALAERHSLALLEDASQAHGARLAGRPVGSFGHGGAFSLYPTKNLGAAGDAGIAVSRDSALIERVRVLANYGERRQHQGEVIGHNSRLDEIQAAMLRVKLRHLEAWNARRVARAEQYREGLVEVPGLTLPLDTPGATPVWHQFVIRHGARDALREALARRGIGTLVHYPIPPHRTEAYRDAYPEVLPVTERLAETVVSLPISPQLSAEACAEVCAAVAASAQELDPG